MYDVEADWQVLNTCNYRCGYCFLAPELLGEKLVQYATPDGWAAAFNATGLTWLLHLTGGEPSIYPTFVELCEKLTVRHYLSLNSNLTNSSWLEFAARVDPKKVNFINAGFHYFEREVRSGFLLFERHLAALIKADFSVFVSVVATPQILAAPDRIFGYFKALGIVPFPKLLQGEFNGQIYPAAYTQDERVIFGMLAAKARQANEARIKDWSETPSIDLSDDVSMLHKVERFTGRSCAAGQKFISLRENGDGFRCSTKQRLGNMLDGTLVLKTAPERCDTSYCPYFCRKYTAMVPKAERKLVWLDENWWREKVWESRARLRSLINVGGG